MAKAPFIGQLDRRICIQQPVTSRGSSGQEVTTWTTFAECWASIEYPGTKSDEGVIADQEVSTTFTVFTIRYRDGIGQKMRVVYGGDYYDIQNKFEIGRKEFLRLPCIIHE